MTFGGVFDGPNSLGTFTHAMGEDIQPGMPGASIPCVGQDFVRAIQLKLVTLGYKIPVDGIWTQCTASAWLKENGNMPLATKDQVKNFLGVDCSSGYIEPSGFLAPGPWSTVIPYCTDGSDVKGQTTQPTQPGTTTPQPPAIPVDCLNKCASLGFGQEAWQCVQNCTGIQAPPLPTFPGTTPTQPGTTTPTQPGTTTTTKPPTETNYTTYALVAVGVVAVGALAYYASQKKKKAPEGLKQNRRRRYVRNCKYC